MTAGSASQMSRGVNVYVCACVCVCVCVCVCLGGGGGLCTLLRFPKLKIRVGDCLPKFGQNIQELNCSIDFILVTDLPGLGQKRK